MFTPRLRLSDGGGAAAGGSEGGGGGGEGGIGIATAVVP